MARPLRVEYPGAIYHAMARSNNQQAIFLDDRDRVEYLLLPGLGISGETRSPPTSHLWSRAW